MPRRILLALGWRGIPSRPLRPAGGERSPESRGARLLLACLVRFAPELALWRLAAGDPRYARAGERLVERSLRRRGWRFLARRLETAQGEVDLLFAERGTLVVVEVKTGRAGPRFHPGQRLGREQLARLWRAARGLARGAPHRVDLAEVLLEPGRGTRLVCWPGIRAPLS